jgi:hypothetical protein
MALVSIDGIMIVVTSRQHDSTQSLRSDTKFAGRGLVPEEETVDGVLIELGCDGGEPGKCPRYRGVDDEILRSEGGSTRACTRDNVLEIFLLDESDAAATIRRHHHGGRGDTRLVTGVDEGVGGDAVVPVAEESAKGTTGESPRTAETEEGSNILADGGEGVGTTRVDSGEEVEGILFKVSKRRSSTSNWSAFNTSGANGDIATFGCLLLSSGRRS